VASDANQFTGCFIITTVSARITPREAARLQGFPDNLCFIQELLKAYYQLGNSVSINVVKAVAQK
jgi:DNA (cytosine-5)-methyltransferase 1